MRKPLFIILLVLFNTFSGFSVTGLQFENITTKNGLSQNVIRCMMQDSRGFMWIGTWNGLNRYDGREFIVMLPEFAAVSLDENRIRNIVEDKDGCLWIHTFSDIINCYSTRQETFVDYTGNEGMKNYRNILVCETGDVWLWGANGCCRIRHNQDKLEPSFFDEVNIESNVVNFVYEGSDKNIWIGTDKGLILFSGEKQTNCIAEEDQLSFQSAVELGKNIYFFTNNNKIVVFDKLKRTYLYDITIDPTLHGNLKINQTCALDESKILITTRQDTYILDINTSSVVSADPFFEKKNISNAYFLIDNKKGIWVYNKSGSIWQYSSLQKSFKEIKLIPETILPQIDQGRFSVHHDSRNIIWITTYGNGLFVLDQNTGKIDHYTKSSSGLQTDYLLSITEDKSGEIWIGTEYAGISKVLMTNYKNKIFYPDKENSNSSYRVIRAILEDRNGDIWIGTKSGHIYVVDKDLNRKKTISLRKGMPYVFAEDTVGNKWVGTKGGGLLIFPSGSNIPDNPIMGPNDIYAILQDSKGRMWLGTFSGGLYLCERDKEGELVFRKFSNLNQRRIRCIIEDSNGLLWIGGNQGVVVFDPDELIKNDKAYTSFVFDNKVMESLNNDEVKTIFEDSNGRIWIGTSGGGLNLLLEAQPLSESRFKHYTSQNGLVNDMVQAILEDNDKNLWISTESGISKFNLNQETFENFNFSNVWDGDLFTESSCFKRKNGELMFGSYNGMYIFDASSFENHPYIPPVTFTNLRINGEFVKPNDKGSPLKVSISETKSIRLKNDQNSFSIEFASLNFSDPYSKRYTYILDGYEKNWNPATRYNVATYQNIPSGEYVFKVRDSNSAGVWNDETKLEIIVVPPLWKSPLAIIIYALLFLGVAFFAVKLMMKMNKLHNDVEVEKQLTNYRLRFFTNISHEFRTPLTIIRGTIENLVESENLSPDVDRQIKTLDKSSSRLLRLIDQLLEFRKLQNNRMELNLEKTEAVSFFFDIHNVFMERAGKKKIDFTFVSNKESHEMLLDRSKMDKVVYNLLSNAFKYTPEGGKVNMEISFDDTNDSFTLRVSDSGIGIPKEKQAMLFVRFKQINYSSSGTGIGLHLTSELVNVHKGNISYSDSEMGGACFTVVLSLSGSRYDKEDIIPVIPEALETNKPVALEEQSEEIPVRTLNSYKILVIEDDEEVREYLKYQLEEYFTVVTAENGLIGVEVADKEQPNLIICDVMMPELDGFEVTRRLKADFESSHIPIILLTAHSSQEHQLEGIDAGADAYIIKPFSMKFLMARIVKLIEQREKLRQKFAKEPGLHQSTIYTTNKDKEFLEKINKIIEENLTNPDFSVDQFAQTVNMGRTVFYKKIKGITGHSPNEYLRIIRMKKAAELLSTTNMNVSEVSYKVGINDPFYFSKCFKSQFGKSPSLFMKGE